MASFNQSFIELLFCCQRSGLFGKIDLQTYNSRMGVLTTNGCFKSLNADKLKASGMYDSEDVGIVIADDASQQEGPRLVSLKPMKQILKEKQALIGNYKTARFTKST